MCTVRFIGDLHNSHTNLILNKRNMTVEEHDKLIITNWNKIIKKQDKTYILGDLTMEKANYSFLNELNGRKIVLTGNHELEQHTPELLKYVDYIIGCLEYKGAIITHIPIHPQEIHRFRFNIHAHMHEEVIKRQIYKPFSGTVKEEIDTRYVCVSCEQINYSPITFEEALAKTK